jgi:hypothetical protein
MDAGSHNRRRAQGMSPSRHATTGVRWRKGRTSLQHSDVSPTLHAVPTLPPRSTQAGIRSAVCVICRTSSAWAASC